MANDFLNAPNAHLPDGDTIEVHSGEWIPNESARLAAKRLEISESLTGPYVAFGVLDGEFISEAKSSEELDRLLRGSKFGPDYDEHVVIHILNDR